MNYPTLSTERAVSVYEELIGLRRLHCEDHEFFNMADFWESLCDDLPDWKIKLLPPTGTDDYARKAGVIEFADRGTLIVDARLLENARRGCLFSNFILGHEFAHVGLGHHKRNAVVKHYALFEGKTGKMNIPPTPEEYEANLGAVFFQCGVALEDENWSTLDLARRAHTDVATVRRAQQRVRLDVFQKKLLSRREKRIRVIL
ncbi:hypothetical protein [Roseinatronobacter sp.]